MVQFGRGKMMKALRNFQMMGQNPCVLQSQCAWPVGVVGQDTAVTHGIPGSAGDTSIFGLLLIRVAAETVLLYACCWARNLQCYLEVRATISAKYQNIIGNSWLWWWCILCFFLASCIIHPYHSRPQLSCWERQVSHVMFMHFAFRRQLKIWL